jgi:transcriptional regulator with XRE-family HTH domain
VLARHVARLLELGPVNNVRLFREAKGWSKAELARQSGVSESNIGRIEEGAVDPNIVRARALARALGVTIDALFPEEKAAV